MVQVSEDIFYQVKKQILDKLDVVLQKVNLEIINYIHPNEDQFTFIELSSFQMELQNLFHYLDRLYASLNSSVSFSSINSYKSTVENYQVENQKLHHQIQQLRSFIKDISHQKIGINKVMMNKQSQEQQILKKYCRALKDQVKILSSEMNIFSKQIKAILKGYKFETLQSRVQIISKLKQFQLASYKSNKIEMGCYNEQNHQESSQQILNAINQILLIC